MQVAWHPHSESHFVVLGSDNTLRLYDLSDLSLAEQTFHLVVDSRGTAGKPSGRRLFQDACVKGWETLTHIDEGLDSCPLGEVGGWRRECKRVPAAHKGNNRSAASDKPLDMHQFAPGGLS
jgi:hypothetical protein